jgi:hypothetical protein
MSLKLRAFIIAAFLFSVTAHALTPTELFRKCFLKNVQTSLATQNEKSLNKNVEQGLARYKQINTRVVGDLDKYLGKEFTDQTQSMAWNDKMLESGAGLGGIAMTAARRDGFSTVAVNKQDFWSEIEQTALALREAPAIDPETIQWAPDPGRQVSEGPEKKIGSVTLQVSENRRWIFPSKAYGIDLEPLRLFAVKLGIYKSVSYFERTPEGERDALNSVNQLFKDLQNYFDRIKATGRFEYQVDYSEDYLSKTKQRFKVITDFFGSFYYSATRPLLLEQYYDHLAPGGKAFLYFGENDVLDTVFNDGKEIPLIDFLKKKYPSLIQIIRFKNSTAIEVIITKNPAIDKIRLHIVRDYSQPVTYHIKGSTNYELPVTKYIESR